MRRTGPWSAGAILRGGEGHKDHLYVHSSVAGTGLAGEIIDTLLAAGAAQWVGRFYVEASELARALFARKGFALVKRRDFEPRGVMIHNYAMERVEAV